MTSILAPSRQGVSLLHLTAIAKSGHTRRVLAQLCDLPREPSPAGTLRRPFFEEVSIQWPSSSALKLLRF